VALLVVVYAVSEWGIRWLQAPWSYEALGPTLTGSWEGPLRARLGQDYRLYVELGYRDPGRRWRLREDNIEGHGWVCNRHGDVFEVNVGGKANRAGDHLTLRLSHVDPVRSGLWTDLEGAWTGSALTFPAARNPFLPDGRFVQIRTVSSSDPDDSFGPIELRKADRASFLAACGRLGG
jgi:hypothetical protein